jgi:hypothetical protein
MTKLTNTEKKKMIVDAINLQYKTGYDQTTFIGKPLSYFNYDMLFDYIRKLNNENMEQGGDNLFEHRDETCYSNKF